MSDEVSDLDNARRKEFGLNVQPSPEPNNHPSAHDLVRSDIANSTPMILSMRAEYANVLTVFVSLAESLGVDPTEIMASRKNFGLEKYGTLLQPFNGRKHLDDALDELADALVYYRSEIYEKEGH